MYNITNKDHNKLKSMNLRDQKIGNVISSKYLTKIISNKIII